MQPGTSSMTDAEPQGLSIVVPVFNERDSAASMVARMLEICAVCDAAEIIIVDDGSTDGSEAILAGLVTPFLRVIRHECNRGYGAALKSGIHAAQYDLVAITDADDTYPDHRIPELYHRMRTENLDMLVGARVGRAAKIPLLRRPAKWALNQLANYLSDTRIPDLNSGLRVMRKQVIARFANILPDGFSFTTTITLAMLTRGYRVAYCPVEYARRSGRSKIRPLHDTLNFIQLIIRTVLYFNPLRVFIPISVALAMCAVLVLVLSALFARQIMDVTFGTLVMTAVNVLAVGMLADLIDKRLR